MDEGCFSKSSSSNERSKVVINEGNGCLITAASLVLDLRDGALGPPVNGVRQRLVVAGVVPRAELAVPLRLVLDAEVRGAVLVVGEVGESVEAEAEGVGGGVVPVDVAQVVLEHLVPALLLADEVVRLAVARHPVDVHPPRLLLAPLAVGDDRHVRRRRQRQQKQQRRRRERRPRARGGSHHHHSKVSENVRRLSGGEVGGGAGRSSFSMAGECGVAL
jgi:hypothetical protein